MKTGTSKAIATPSRDERRELVVVARPDEDREVGRVVAREEVDAGGKMTK
jgi:hypothetical protein